MTDLKRARHEKPEISTSARLEARAMSQTEVIRLSIEDQRQIAKALLRPSKPNPALQRAFQRRRQLLGG